MVLNAKGYIGDGYPLCVDLPDRMFLRTSARYRLLGSSSLPELQEDHSSWASDETIIRLVLDESSFLRAELCAADETGACQYANNVVLGGPVECVGTECLVDTVRVVQVAESVFYEYVRPPCVEQAFYTGAMKVKQGQDWRPANCANPLLPAASEACCANHPWPYRNKRYDGERMTFSTAESRCAEDGRTLCDYSAIQDDWFKLGYHWTNVTCQLDIKVDTVGNVAIVYQPESVTQLVRHADSANLNYFKVYWDGEFPNAANSCGGGACQVLADGGCRCHTTVSETSVFDSSPSSIAEAMSQLYIGGVDPAIQDPNTYTSSVDDGSDITSYVLVETGVLDSSTIFSFTDEVGRNHVLKNSRETVHVLDGSMGSTSFAFRSAPSFNSNVHTESTARDAQYETEATLDHYFYHENTAPFIATRMIQRFTTSNPSPRYVETVAMAFRSGRYEAFGETFGSGDYGDLVATIAAVLLDREATSVELGQDPSHGILREQILKVVGLMRSMEYTTQPSSPIVRLENLAERIGQMAFEFPTVFSFFLPEFRPTGRVGDASLVGPEAMLIDMPKTINLLNGMFSMVKYGLSNCHHGFSSVSNRWWGCNEGNYGEASGYLSYSPSSQTPREVVNELATLLTAGRLDESNREILVNAYESAGSAEAGLRLAQQLILTTPEFHSTNTVTKSGGSRDAFTPPDPSGVPYKAIVFIMFAGGCDSYQLLVPHTCSAKDMYAEYAQVREQVALPRESLLPISADNQVCETFGVHPRLPIVRDLYVDGDLLFIANAGVMTQPVTKENYYTNTRTQLFAHNHMQRETQAVDPYEEIFGTGVGGRMAGVLSSDDVSMGVFGIDQSAATLVGIPGESPDPFILSQSGIKEFNPASSAADMMARITALNEATNADSGFFAETWSDGLLKSIANNELLYTTLEGATTTNTFPDTDFGRKLRMVAQMIGTRDTRGVDTDIFYVEMGGYDTHQSVETNLNNLFDMVQGGMTAFTQELKDMGVWQQVTGFQVSEFARTLAPNSGDGTDHAWGGNYMLFGGDVAGGKVVGTFPDDLTDDGPLGLGRGRLIPTTPWEGPLEKIAEWAGVTSASGLDTVCPNRHSFPESMLLTTEVLFESGS